MFQNLRFGGIGRLEISSVGADGRLRMQFEGVRTDAGLSELSRDRESLLDHAGERVQLERKSSYESR